MSASKIALNTEKQLDIPKELWMMVDHLFRSAVKQVRKCWLFCFLFCFFQVNILFILCIFLSFHSFFSFLFGQLNSNYCMFEKQLLKRFKDILKVLKILLCCVCEIICPVLCVCSVFCPG